MFCVFSFGGFGHGRAMMGIFICMVMSVVAYTILLLSELPRLVKGSEEI